MILAVLLAAASPANAVEAERAFAADAVKLGQWTAFRKWSTPDALMFVPQPIKAHDFLKDKVDPPTTVIWQPSASFTSCDGSVAATHGPWRRPDGSVGHFFTIWERKGTDRRRSWRWVFDAGISLADAFSAKNDPSVRTAACTPIRAAAKPKGTTIAAWRGSVATHNGKGMSRDRTLVWSWYHSKQKGTWLHVEVWNGQEFKTVVDTQAAAP